MGTTSKYVETELIEGVFSCIKRDIFHDGACQCLGDCDCCKREGEFLYQEHRFKHPLSSKKFKTLSACKESYETLKSKISSQHELSEHKCGCSKPLYVVRDKDGNKLGVTHLGDGDEEHHYSRLNEVVSYDVARSWLNDQNKKS